LLLGGPTNKNMIAGGAAPPPPTELVSPVGVSPTGTTLRIIGCKYGLKRSIVEQIIPLLRGARINFIVLESF
jgi:hypothetical protein